MSSSLIFIFTFIPPSSLPKSYLRHGVRGHLGRHGARRVAMVLLIKHALVIIPMVLTAAATGPSAPAPQCPPDLGQLILPLLVDG